MVRINTNVVKILFQFFWDICAASSSLIYHELYNFQSKKYRHRDVGSKIVSQKESVEVWETWNQAVRKEWGRYVKSIKELILYLQAELSSKVQNIFWK